MEGWTDSQPEVSQPLSDVALLEFEHTLTLKLHSSHDIQTQPKFRLGLEPMS